MSLKWTSPPTFQRVIGTSGHSWPHLGLVYLAYPRDDWADLTELAKVRINLN